MTLPVRLTLAAVQDVALAERWYREEAPHVLTAASYKLPAVYTLSPARKVISTFVR